MDGKRMTQLLAMSKLLSNEEEEDIMLVWYGQRMVVVFVSKMLQMAQRDVEDSIITE